jgi:hypothetical protein
MKDDAAALKGVDVTYFTKRHDWHERLISPSELVRCAVSDAPWYDDGQVETLHAQVLKLTEIVGMLVARLPENDMIDLAGELGFIRAELKNLEGK